MSRQRRCPDHAPLAVIRMACEGGDCMANTHRTLRLAIRAAIIVVVLLALYLLGFVVAVQLGPALPPSVAAILEVIYWPLISCDRNNMEPLATGIGWLKFR